jgi:hypothetical protein
MFFMNGASSVPRLEAGSHRKREPRSRLIGHPARKRAAGRRCRCPHHRCTSSTRRFLPRPASVSLLASGARGPTPAGTMRGRSTPWRLTSKYWQ